MTSERESADLAARLLHGAYDPVVPTSDLQARVAAQIRTAASGSGTARSANRPRRYNRRWAAIIAAAAVVVIAGSAAVVTTLLRGDHSGATATPTTSSPAAADCTHPTRPYVPFGVAVAGSDEAGAPLPPDQLAGGASVPYNVIYHSGGPLGTGSLCLSSAAYPGGAVALAPRPGEIAYLGLADGDVPWGAVRPGVASLTFTRGGATDTYSIDNRVPEFSLHDIGGGWHAFNSFWSLGSTGTVTVTVRAYDGAGHLLDTAHLSVSTAARSSAATPATR